MEHDGQIAFWINVHNALVMHVIFTLTLKWLWFLFSQLSACITLFYWQ